MASPLKSASVIIPCYNYGQYVADAIESGLNQTFRAIEVIVVDDGSTDNSLEVIKSFGDRIRVISQMNSGHAAAENAGFACASGDLILFLDADDLLYPTAVETAIERFGPTTSKVQFYLEALTESKQSRGYTMPEKMPAEQEIERLLFGFGSYPSPPTSGNAYARQFLERVLPFPEKEYLGATDNYVMVLAPLYGQVKVCPQTLGGYRLHGKNMSELLNSQSVQRMREEIVINAVRQRTLEVHCKMLGRAIRSELDLRQPYTCKRRMISMKADPQAHPFPNDRAVRLAWKGLMATLIYPDLSIANRLALVISFISIPVLPRRLIKQLVPVLDGGRRQLVEFYSRMFQKRKLPLTAR
jgi:glycosyltransferase involved in cell wall biosynthesis